MKLQRKIDRVALPLHLRSDGKTGEEIRECKGLCDRSSSHPEQRSRTIRDERMMWHSGFRIVVAVTAVMLVLQGCSDMGMDPVSSQVAQPPPSPVSQNVSFKSEVVPILNKYGCAGCHGGSGGLYVQGVSQLLQGGIHGPAVAAGNADGSLLVRKLSSGPPFGDRMPQGGPYLPDSTLNIIREWINQGAKDN